MYFCRIEYDLNLEQIIAILARCFVFLACCCYFIGCQPNKSPTESYSLPTYFPASAIPFSDIENVYIDELHDEPNKYVFAINRDVGDQGRGAYWGTLDQYGWIRIYETGPRVSLFQVSYISISDDDKYLAIETTGEGHPGLDIFELQNWLIYAPRGGDRDAPPLDPIASLGAYPFSFKSLGWKDNKFVLESHGPLDKLEQRRLSGDRYVLDEELENKESYTFVWDVENDRLRRE